VNLGSRQAWSGCPEESQQILRKAGRRLHSTPA